MSGPFVLQILFENKCKNRLAEISDRVELDKKEVRWFRLSKRVLLF